MGLLNNLGDALQANKFNKTLSAPWRHPVTAVLGIGALGGLLGVGALFKGVHDRREEKLDRETIRQTEQLQQMTAQVSAENNAAATILATHAPQPHMAASPAGISGMEHMGMAQAASQQVSL